jgi:plasmid stabilization system protein ParE
MYKLLVLPNAKTDIREAALWYNDQQNGLGKRFISDVRKKIHFIGQNPAGSNVRYDDVRTAVLNIFPYMIHYTVDEDIKTVIVSAVLHTSRDPQLWQER